MRGRAERVALALTLALTPALSAPPPCAAQPAAPAAPAAPADSASFTLGAQLRGDLAAGGGGGGGQLVFGWRLGERLALDAVGRAGYLRAPAHLDDLLALSLALGPAWERALAPGWRGRATLRLTHVHHASVASWGATPGGNLAGDSSGGVRHRSGLEAALGLVGGDLGGPRHRFEWSVELSAGWLPSSAELRYTGALAAGLRWGRR